MKPYRLPLLLAGTLATAQDNTSDYFPGQPSCAVTCLASAISVVGCQLSDPSCLCGTQSAIGGLVLPCFTSSCGAREIEQAMSAGAAVCTPTSTPTPTSAASNTTPTDTDTAASSTRTETLGGGVTPSATNGSAGGSLATGMPSSAAAMGVGGLGGLLAGVLMGVVVGL
ncbi:hypothetical protein F4810DRAFT_27710 [Camillea tinctor]|nr:hypothetical protein F4810DRAFT_27710 [Camillea tinctor]